jgi:hypothetical protein
MINSVGDGWRRMGQWSNNSDREKLKYLKNVPVSLYPQKFPNRLVWD